MKAICSLLLLFFIGITSFAQEEIIIIDRGKNKREKRSSEPRLIENTGAVKFSPLQMFVGEINFGYERQLSAKSSFEVELGPTISEIRFGQVNTHVVPWGQPTAIQESEVGFHGSIAYRHYPLDQTEALNRFYVSPIMKYRLYNFGVSDPSNMLPRMSGNDNQMIFLFNFGYQLWASNSFGFDFFLGMGIGTQAYKTYYPESEFVNNDWQYTWVESFDSGARYYFSGGLKVAIGHK